MIDVDPPKWEIGHYQPVDEAFYVYPAYNAFEYSDINKDNELIVFGTPILTNLSSYITLHLLGDNYWGLRSENQYLHS